MQLAVIGLGKLGCPMAALFASAGHDVVGADLSEDSRCRGERRSCSRRRDRSC